MIPPTVDSVIVMDVKRSKLLGSKVLFMLRMNDTLLPSVKSNDILLSDNEKIALKSAGFNINTTMTDNINQERNCHTYSSCFPWTFSDIPINRYTKL